MKSETDFDEFLKDKFSGTAGFSFEEDKWTRMEELIIAEEAKRKRRKFLFIFMGGFMTALVLVIPVSWYIFTGFQKESKLKENKIKGDLHNASDIPAGAKINNLVSGNHPTAHQADPKKTTENTTETEDKSGEARLESGKTRPVSENKTKNTGDQGSRRKNHFLALENRDRKTSLQTGKEDPGPQVELTKEPETAENFAEEENNEVQVNTLGETNKQIGVSENVQVKDSLNTKDTLTAMNNPVDSLPQNTRIADSTLLPQDENKPAFYAVSGLQYNLGYAEDDGTSFSPFAALTIQVKLSPVWSLISGLGYFQVSKLNHEKTITQRTYSFGYVENLFTIRQYRFHYVYLPVEMNYGKNKNNFGLGLNLAYLFANNNQIIEQQSNALGEANGVKRYSYRYAYGLSSLDLQFSAAYSRDLGTKFKAGASYTIGVSDVRKNEWTGNTAHEKNQFVRFTLMYKFK